MPVQLERVAAVRARCRPDSCSISAASEMEPVVALMRAGIDVTIPREDVGAAVLARMLDLVQTREQERYRVLVVEDSRVAAAMIRRTSANTTSTVRSWRTPASCSTCCRCSARPDPDGHVHAALHRRRGDARPAPGGRLPVGADRLSLERVGHRHAGRGIAAGATQFLQKPINPVVLAAVVRTKIERYRETIRSTRTDGLTGLFNHTASKARLKGMIEVLPAGSNLCPRDGRYRPFQVDQRYLGTSGR